MKVGACTFKQIWEIIHIIRANGATCTMQWKDFEWMAMQGSCGWFCDAFDRSCDCD